MALSIRNFNNVIQQHNSKKGSTLQDFRDLFERIAPQLADFVKQNLGQSYADQMYPLLDPSLGRGHDPYPLPHACHIDRDVLEALFKKKPKRKPKEHVFNGWEGFWQGPWKSIYPGNPDSDYEKDQKHVWGDTQAQERDGQYVQPVTIAEGDQGYVTDDTISDLGTGSGGGDPATNVYDPAINVVDSNGNVTGWVSRRKDGSAASGAQHELPHVGYYALDRVAGAHVLIWITQKHDANCNAASPGEFFIYLEWAKWIKGRGRYGILGKELKIDESATGGPQLSTNQNLHGGLYSGRPLMEGP